MFDNFSTFNIMHKEGGGGGGGIVRVQIRGLKESQKEAPPLMLFIIFFVTSGLLQYFFNTYQILNSNFFT